MLWALRRLLPDGRVVVYECRRCGTNVDSEYSSCPNCECDHDTIACYDIH